MWLYFLVTEIVLAIIALGLLLGARIAYYKEDERTKTSNILAAISGTLSIILCALIIILDWNLWTIPKLLFFASLCTYIIFKKKRSFYYGDKPCVPFWVIFIAAAVVTCIVVGISLKNTICEESDYIPEETSIANEATD